MGTIFNTDRSIESFFRYLARCWSVFVVLIAIGLFAFSNAAQAERPSDMGSPYQYIAQLGQVAFNQDGGPTLPTSVLQSMYNGQLSPIMQFVLVNNTMNKCIQDVINKYPKRRDSDQLSNAKYEFGVCELQKCFQNAMLVMLLPQLSSNPAAGGSTNTATKNAAQAQGAALAATFSKSSCGDSGGGGGIDPALLAIFAAQ